MHGDTQQKGARPGGTPSYIWHQRYFFFKKPSTGPGPAMEGLPAIWHRKSFFKKPLTGPGQPPMRDCTSFTFIHMKQG